LRTIAAELAAEMIPTAQGGAKWHASTIKAVLDGQDVAQVSTATASDEGLPGDHTDT
jgi:hypothetical protein